MRMQYNRYLLLIIFFFILITVSACSLQKSQSVMNSDSSQQALVGEDIRPTKIAWSKKLIIQTENLYINDDGLQQIIIPSSTLLNTQSNEKIDISNEIITYLDNPNVVLGEESIMIKQLSIHLQWSQFSIIWGKDLFDYILPLNASLNQSGDNLLVSANILKKDAASYLLISNKNLENYTINDQNDRFSTNLFLIPKEEYLILKIQWNDDLHNPSLFYASGDVKHTINYTNDDMFAIPDETTLMLWYSYKNPNTSITVLHVTQDPLSSKKANCDQYINHIPKGTIEKMQDQFSGWNNISSCEILIADENWEYSFISKKLSGSQDSSFNQSLIILSPAHHKILSWYSPKFSVDLVDSIQDDFPYVKQIISNYQLDPNDTNVALSKIFGTGEYENFIDFFRYKIQPNKKYTWDLLLKSIFWQSIIVPLSLYIDTIDSRAITQQILTNNNTISVLPSSWSFQDILVQHINTGSFTVSFSPCDITNSIDRTQNNGQGLENYLFTCDEKIFNRTVTTANFSFWKSYRTAVSLPDDFPERQAFKVFIPSANWKMESFFYYKSDIGIWSKVAWNKLHIRGFLFENNSPITTGSITIHSIGNIQKDPVTLPINKTETVYELLVNEYGSPINNNLLLVTISTPLSWDAAWWVKSSFVVIDPRRSNMRYNESTQQSYNINSYLNPQDVVTSTTNSMLSFRWEEYPIKLYAYTDRGLYKAGDTVFIAGFVRDLRNFISLDYLQNKTITIVASDTEWNHLYTNENITLDDFWWFETNFLLPNSLALDDIIISYVLNNDTMVNYSHNIKVEEYQKPTFYINTTHVNKDDVVHLVTSPNYYFWQALHNYDIKISWSIAGKDTCPYCRRRNQETYYYNYVFNDTISTGGEITLYNQVDANLSTPLFPTSLLSQRGYQYSLKANITIKDNNSDETQFFTRYIDFNPDVKIWLSGQPYEWLYNENWKDTRKDFSLTGEIKGGKENIKNIWYEVFYRSYDQTVQQWIDGSLYYLNGNQYLSIFSGSILPTSNFELGTAFITKPGSYLLRVYAKDIWGNIIGEVQKQIEYYEFNNNVDDLLWTLPNNYTLTIDVPKKIYEAWEEIPINIAPYQKWARVLIHIERWNQIIETIEKTLDWSPLTIRVKPGYAPNIVLNVLQIIGTDKINWPRKEPRFLVWYAQADISTAMHEMNIDIATDKSSYKPNETVNIHITTRDSKWNPIDARISLWVIDKALMAMYDVKKEPLPYFFNKLGTSIANYTNMKLLYQSLRAFANNGSKWWSWLGGQASFSIIRDDFEDIAYWKGAIYTTWGKADISFQVPENLTTWVIDAIGISKDTKLGTTQTLFNVTKDLIIEANPPSFVTLWDELLIPVKLIVAPDIYEAWKYVYGSAKLIWWWEVLDLGTFTEHANSKIFLTTKIPSNRLWIETVDLVIEGSYENEKDSIQQSIPLRTTWLIMRDWIGVINSSGEHVFQIPSSYTKNATISITQFPTNFIDPLLQYLAGYPYWCTEQILSSLLPLHVAQELQKTKKLPSLLLHDDYVETYDGSVNINKFFTNGVSQILNRQNSDGSFGLWKKDEAPASLEQYMLSSYVYSSLIYLRNKGSSAVSIDQALRSANDFLRTYRSLSAEWFLYYLSQKSLAWETLSMQELAEIEVIQAQSLKYGGLLRYIIAIGQGNSAEIEKWRPLAMIPTNDDQWRPESIFLNQTTAYALKLQALIQDTHASQVMLSELLSWLLSLRMKDGLRWSTQQNVQAALALSSLIDKRPYKENITCDIQSDGSKLQTTLSSSGSFLSLPLEDKQNHSIERSCDVPVMTDIIFSYVPKELKDQLWVDSYVSNMEYNISNISGAIGDLVDINTSRTTTIPGQQVAVEIFIPSTLKFLSTIQTQDTDTAFPFTISDFNCQPSHREIKFDRLFLYYEQLEAITCDVSIQALKAYNGTPVIQPMRVYEMYRGKINGRKVLE